MTNIECPLHSFWAIIWDMRLERMQCFSKFLQSQGQCEALPDSISNKQSMSFKAAKIALLQELQQKNNSHSWLVPGRASRKGRKMQSPGDIWRDLPGCCLYQAGSWGTKSLSAHCYSETEMGNSKQAQSSKAAKKKAPSCFIQTEPVAGEPKGTTETPPRLGSQFVSSDYLCINPMKQGAFLHCAGGLLGLLSHQSACQDFWTHFASAKWPGPSQGWAPSLA